MDDARTYSGPPKRGGELEHCVSSMTIYSSGDGGTERSLVVPSSHDDDVEDTIINDKKDDGKTKKKTKTVFKPVIVGFEEILVDPRETLALALFGPRFAAFMFSLWFTDNLEHRYSKIRIFSMLLMYASGICAILSLFGIKPELGWASFASLPMFFQTVLNYNSKLLRRVLATFECQCLIALDMVAIGSLMDAVYFQTPRVLALCVVGLGLFLVTILDARTCTTTPNKPLIINMLGYVLAAWFTLIFFWLNLFIDVRISTWHLMGPIYIQVQSVGMSALTTYAVLCSKTIYMIWKSDEINPRNGLRPFVAFRPVEVDA